MAGRHRKPTNTGRRVARVGALTAIAAAPLAVAGTAMAAPSSDSSESSSSESASSDSASSSGSSSSAPSVEKSSTWDELAHCESTGNWDADTGNGFKGGLQFTPSTWKSFGGTEYAQSADEATRSEQIAVAKEVKEEQGWKAWPACTKKLGWR